MIQLVATEITVVVVFGAVVTLMLALTTLFVGLVFFAVFDDGDDSVRDVRRFIELSEEARALLPHGLPLLDPEGATEVSGAIVLFQAKKDEARKALWQSRERRAGEEPSVETPRAQPHPSDKRGVVRQERRLASRRSAVLVR